MIHRVSRVVAIIAFFQMFCLPGMNGQTFDPFIQSKVDELVYDSLLSDLQTFENIGIKETGSEELTETGEWIISKYAQYGYDDIDIDGFYLGQDSVFNIIITKKGSLYPDTYLIVDGHFDTKNGPGTNDNGTGTAILLEVARIMADVETEYSIRFVHFTAEELGMVGSYQYVTNTVVPQNMDIRLVFNIDEVGGVAGMTNNTVTCERDEWPPNGNNAASAAFTDTLANLTQIYSDLETNISYAYGSDYVPFMENGFVVTGLYEYNESPWPHSINDSLSNLDPDYVFEITKASLAATMYFSGAHETTIHISDHPHYSKNAVSPNPFSDFLEINLPVSGSACLIIYDISGKEVYSRNFMWSQSVTIHPFLPPGIYFYRITGAGGDILDLGKLHRI